MKEREKIITVEIKTPLWTGDIDSKSDLIQPTGIIGSLRWWTEVILRGMDYFACDPTDEKKRCPKEGTKKNRKILKYCPACLIWGATGIRRLFKVELSGGERLFEGEAINIKPKGRNRRWYLGGLKGKIDLQINPLDHDFDGSLLLLPLSIAANWGGIGAKTQHGYGVVNIKNNGELKFENFENSVDRILEEERLEKLNIEERKEANDVLPNLKEMFFAKVQFEANNKNRWEKVDGIKQCRNYEGMKAWINSDSVPIAPAIKNWLRFRDKKNIRETEFPEKDNMIENWLFGTAKRICAHCYSNVKKDHQNPRNFRCPNCERLLEKEETYERMASKINISCAYHVDNDLWEFRIWGWIPKSDTHNGFNREGFLKSLKQALDGSGSVTIPWAVLLGCKTSNHKLKVWREFNSSRDTVKQNEGNINAYLESLLKK